MNNTQEPVNFSTMHSVVDDYIDHYNKYSDPLSETERNECEEILDNINKIISANKLENVVFKPLKKYKNVKS